ncbi:AlpA family transcriptional regulator [Microlunatus sp. Gsoil 973]|uniref:helix-turn-helix transcriptional regulator n=1 Tax=Microlunatus sp. Gsoil 973 TaxID=2672569 RepID=UPI0012B4EFC3|nr:helix-turn-helix domain-containing protein [Microlunatus sp. Gsoil 973]QGN33949.1 helix-turn-helix domain-containing protein [Microlunatus sp. Gsoil 973]
MEAADGSERDDRDNGLHRVAFERLLKPKEVAELFSLSEPTLARWRSEGKGPVWVQVAHRVPRYRVRDLETWVRSHKRGEAA